MGKSRNGGKGCDAVSSARKNIKCIADKLKESGLSSENLLELQSIRTVLLAMEGGEDSQVSTSSETPGDKEDKSSTFEPRAVHGSCNLLSRKNEKETQETSLSSSSCSQMTSSSNISKGAGGLSSLYKQFAGKYFIRPRKPSTSNFVGVFFSILAFIFYFELHTPPGFTRVWLKWENVDIHSVECTIESPGLAMEVFRPPLSCEFCDKVTSVNRVSGISPKDFEAWYAYSARPVIITDAMDTWNATTSFSFEFLKSIYGDGSRSLEHLGEDCLFFPYATEFRSLAQVFNMSQERASHPWYIGWSNCDAETSHILRQHYQRPYFLPTTAESTHADWIFMGTPGYGAHMHIDHVINPSWQAQITGKKRWFLQPPPECFYQCHSFQADVQPGEIIVLDTNKWYHQTLILPGDQSITIGSEYD